MLIKALISILFPRLSRRRKTADVADLAHTRLLAKLVNRTAVDETTHTFVMPGDRHTESVYELALKVAATFLKSGALSQQRIFAVKQAERWALDGKIPPEIAREFSSMINSNERHSDTGALATNNQKARSSVEACPAGRQSNAPWRPKTQGFADPNKRIDAYLGEFPGSRSYVTIERKRCLFCNSVSRHLVDRLRDFCACLEHPAFDVKPESLASFDVPPTAQEHPTSQAAAKDSGTQIDPKTTEWAHLRPTPSMRQNPVRDKFEVYIDGNKRIEDYIDRHPEWMDNLTISSRFCPTCQATERHLIDKASSLIECLGHDTRYDEPSRPSARASAEPSDRIDLYLAKFPGSRSHITIERKKCLVCNSVSRHLVDRVREFRECIEHESHAMQGHGSAQKAIAPEYSYSSSSPRRPNPSSLLPFQRLVFLDFETTGLSPSVGARIIEIGAVEVTNLELGRRLTTLVNPGVTIPLDAQRVHKITDEMLIPAPGTEQCMKLLLEFLGDSPVVAHNASFEKRFLISECKRLNLSYSPKTICTLQLARKIHPELKSHRLEFLMNTYAIKVDKPLHRALADAEYTALLFLEMMKDPNALSCLTGGNVTKH